MRANQLAGCALFPWSRFAERVVAELIGPVHDSPAIAGLLPMACRKENGSAYKRHPGKLREKNPSDKGFPARRDPHNVQTAAAFAGINPKIAG